MTDEEMAQLSGGGMTDEQVAGVPTDMGPSARRVATGKAPGPREQSDVDLGIEGGMETPPEPSFNFDKMRSGLGNVVGTPRKGADGRPIQAMEHDPMAQMAVSGAVLGPLGNALRGLSPFFQRTIPSAVIGAGEGVAGAKMMGAENSDLAVPGILGGLFGAIGPFGRAVRESKGGQARAFLDEQGLPPTEPPKKFGAPSDAEFDPTRPVQGMGDLDNMQAGTAINMLEKHQSSLPARDPVIDAQIAEIRAKANVSPRLPEVDAARRTLEFSPPNRGDMIHGGMAGLAAHALHLPPYVQALLAIASAGARNLPAIEGRVLYPFAAGVDSPAWMAPTFGAATGER